MKARTIIRKTIITKGLSRTMNTDRVNSPSKKAGSFRRAVRARRTPNLYKPWGCVIVGIDPSSRAHGYSLFFRGQIIDSGSFSIPNMFAGEIDSYTHDTLQLYNQHKIVFVSEDWGGSVLALKALCAERMRWRHSVELYRGSAKWATVNTSTWAAAYGIHRMRSKGRKARSILLAEQIKRSSVKDDNEADAILIGSFACYWDGLSGLGIERCE